MRIEVKPIFHHREACILRQTSVLARSARITIFLTTPEGSLVSSSRTSSGRTHREFLAPHVIRTSNFTRSRHRTASQGRARRVSPCRSLSLSPRRCASAPLKIAEADRAGIGPIEGIEKCRSRGAGYINVRIDRAGWPLRSPPIRNRASKFPAGKILVEHSSINPNKAAHIGHLRNAILGDTFVRLLRFAGREVDVQNYIDNTGVQVADVVVGFMHLEKKSRAEIEALTRQPRFDYYCWDLYARVSQWYEQDKQNLQVARQDAARDRRSRQRNRGHRRSDLDRRAAPPSRNHGPARHRIRLPAARERNPAPALLGRGLRQAERSRRALPSRPKARTKAAG